MSAGTADRSGARFVLDLATLAAGTLTAIPVPAPARIDRRTAGWAMTVGPLVMLPILAVLAVVAVAGTALGLPPEVLAPILVAGLALSSRGLHLDGLADTCDGLAAGYDRTRALSVLRRGDVGPAGVAAVVLVLLVQTACLTALLGIGSGPVPAGLLPAALAVLASRHDLAWACRSGRPAAHPDGLGAAVIGTVRATGLAVSALALTLLSVGTAMALGRSGWYGLAVPVAAVAAGELLRRRAVRRFGGLSGDVLGAGVELALTAALLAGLVLAGLALAGSGGSAGG